MCTRLVSGGLILIVGLALSTSLAAAESGSLSVGSGGSDGEVAGGFSAAGQIGPVGPVPSGPWNPTVDCATGASVLPNVGDPNQFMVTVFRWAIEFPLAGLPNGATVTGASLALTVRAPYPEGLTQVAIYGYPGDGSITAADVVVGGSPVLITPTESGVRESWDVTSLLTTDVLTAGWAGFSLRTEPLVGIDPDVWDCRDQLYPILTIQYEVPATPTPNAVPDTATGGGAHPSFVVGLFLLFAASGVVLLASGLRMVTHRR